MLSISHFQAQATRVSAAVRGGESLSSALRQLSFIPAVALQLVRAGETSGRLARMSERSAVLLPIFDLQAMVTL